MPNSSKGQSRWYPTQTQLKDPSTLERSFRQLLDQHYALQDQFTKMQAEHARINEAHAKIMATLPKENQAPPGSGPTDSQLLGLRVAPVDVNSLADGTKLTFVKASGNLQFI